MKKVLQILFLILKLKTIQVFLEHEATTAVREEQKYYLMQRGLSEEDAVNVLVSGFAKEVTKNLLRICGRSKCITKGMEGPVG